MSKDHPPSSSPRPSTKTKRGSRGGGSPDMDDSGDGSNGGDDVSNHTNKRSRQKASAAAPGQVANNTAFGSKFHVNPHLFTTHAYDSALGYSHSLSPHVHESGLGLGELGCASDRRKRSLSEDTSEGIARECSPMKSAPALHANWQRRKAEKTLLAQDSQRERDVRAVVALGQQEISTFSHRRGQDQGISVGASALWVQADAWDPLPPRVGRRDRGRCGEMVMGMDWGN